MSKILLWTDPHITLHNEFSEETEDGLTTYLQEIKDTFNWLSKLIAEYRPDVSIFLGDYWDASDTVDVRSLSVGVDCIKAITDSIPANFFLIGNHDSYDQKHKIHTLRALSSHGVCVEKAEQLKVAIVDGVNTKDPFTVGFLPWGSNPKDINIDVVDIIVSHVPINGVVRFMSNDGTANLEDSGYNQAAFQNKLAFSGHYHRPGEYGNVICVGSLLSKSFSDINSPPRGVIIYDTETKDWERFQNPRALRYEDVYVNNESKTGYLILDNGVWCEDTDLSNVNARIRYNPDTDIELVNQVSSLCNQHRLIEERSVVEVRQEAFRTDKTPIDNLRTYLNLTLNDVESNLIDDYTNFIENLVLKHPPENLAPGILFESIAVNNFLSWESYHYNYLAALTLIEGVNHDDPTSISNGAGKTAYLTDCIKYTFDGTTFRGAKGDDVIKEGEDYLNTALTFKSGKYHYTVKRTRNDKVLGTGLKLYQNDLDISARTSKMTEEKLQSVLGVSPDSILKSILLNNDQPRYSKLGPTDRLRLLEDMGNLLYYEQLGVKCKALTTVIRNECNTLLIDHSVISGKIDVFEDQFTRLSEDKLVGVQEAIDEGGRLILNIEVSVIKLGKLEDELATLKSAYDSAREKEQLSTNKVQSLLLEVSKYSTASGRYDQSINHFKTELGRYESAVNAGVCPECEQKVESSVYESRVEELQRQLDNLNNEKVEAQQIEAQHKGILDSAIVAHEILQAELEAKFELSNKVTIVDQINELKDRISEFNTKLSSLNNRWGFIDKSLTDIRKQIHDLNNKLTVVKLKLDTQEVTLSTADWWLTALGPTGVRSFINEQSIGIINQYLKKASPLLLGPRLGVISLSAWTNLKGGGSSNKIDINLTGGRGFKNLSSGQLRKVDLAIQFALNELSAQTGSAYNLLICDEVCDPIDELGLKGIVTLLQDKVSAGVCVFLATHNKALRSLTYGNRLVVHLKNDTSTLKGMLDD